MVGQGRRRTARRGGGKAIYSRVYTFLMSTPSNYIDAYLETLRIGRNRLSNWQSPPEEKVSAAVYSAEALFQMFS